MENRILTKQLLHSFSRYLQREEKSEATRAKYLRDVYRLQQYLGDCPVTRERVSAWKESLAAQGYTVRSINSMLASVNSLLSLLGWQECRVKNFRLQRQIYCAEDKELTKAEYLRLLNAARSNPQLMLALQTICATGIRVSELRCFTVEAVRRGEVCITCKGKTRTILIPGKLQSKLLAYAQRERISSGTVFVSKNGKPWNRSCIWRKMKALCHAAQVKTSKVFPHNLRKLFARTFYATQKDIAKLADLLGHSSINTTRIYIMSTGTEHRRQLDRLGLLL